MQDCAVGSSILAGLIRTSNLTITSCPEYTTSGVVFYAPVAKEWARVTDQEPAINHRTTLVCNSVSVLWGLFASTNCEELSTSETSIGINVIAEAFCAEFVSPPAGLGRVIGEPVPALPPASGGTQP